MFPFDRVLVRKWDRVTRKVATKPAQMGQRKGILWAANLILQKARAKPTFHGIGKGMEKGMANLNHVTSFAASGVSLNFRGGAPRLRLLYHHSCSRCGGADCHTPCVSPQDGARTRTGPCDSAGKVAQGGRSCC